MYLPPKYQENASFLGDISKEKYNFFGTKYENIT